MEAPQKGHPPALRRHPLLVTEAVAAMAAEATAAEAAAATMAATVAADHPSTEAADFLSTEAEAAAAAVKTAGTVPTVAVAHQSWLL